MGADPKETKAVLPSHSGQNRQNEHPDLKYKTISR